MSPKIADLLQREPSQQELEVARQLVEHSQSIQHATATSDAQLQAESAYGGLGKEDERDGNVRSEERRDAVDSPQRYTQGSSGALAVQDVAPSPQGNSSQGGAPEGQMCRYGARHFCDLKRDN